MNQDIEIEEINGDEIYEDYGFEPEEFVKPQLFTLKPFQMVDFPSDENIASYAINNHNIVVTTISRRIFRWRFKDDTGCQELEIKDDADNIAKSVLKLGENVGKQVGAGLLTVGNLLLDTVNIVTKPLFNTNLRFGRKDDINQSKFDKIFLEPRGTHILVCSDKGESFHVGYHEEHIKKLNSLNGKNVKFLLWGESSLRSFKNALLITSENKFYVYSLIWNDDKNGHNESINRSIFQIPPEKNITDVKQIIKDSNQTLIVGTDYSIYIFQGSKDYEILLTRYKECTEDLKAAEKKFEKKSFGSQIVIFNQNILWTDGLKLNYFKYKDYVDPKQFESDRRNLLKHAKKYDSDGTKAYDVFEKLYGIGLTKYHYYLLTFDTITIVSLLTQNVVTYFDLNVKIMGKHPEGMFYDQGTECFWIYFPNGVYSLSTQFEDEEVWKLLVERNEYVEALGTAKKYNSPYYGHIAGLYADDLFEKQQFGESAMQYFFSNKTIYEVFLKFSLNQDVKTINALEKYLQEILLMQTSQNTRQVLLAYILELMVTSKQDQNKMLKFIQQHLEELDEDLVVQVLQPHGFFDLCNQFADLKNDHWRVITNYIQQEQYEQVIEKLRMIKDSKLVFDIIQKFSYALMKHSTLQTLEIIKSQQKIDPTKLISPLLNINRISRDIATDFMFHCVENLNFSDRTFNNLLLINLVNIQKLDTIMKYLYIQQRVLESKMTTNFDMPFALRMFKQQKLLLPQIQIQSMLGRYDIAVQLSLKNNLISVAKEHASRCNDETKQKALWIQIIVHMLNRDEHIEGVVQLITEIEGFNIEDILPFLTKNVKLDYFKNEITQALRTRHELVDKIRIEMDGFYQTAEGLKRDLQLMNNRSIFVPKKAKCEECYRQLFQEEYVIFDCLHTYHKDCLWLYMKKNKEFFDPRKISKLHELQIIMTVQTQQAKIQQQKQEESMFGFFGSKEEAQVVQKKGFNKMKNKVSRAMHQKEFDELISEECVSCGPSIIEMILLPFDLDQDQEESWFI